MHKDMDILPPEEVRERPDLPRPVRLLCEFCRQVLSGVFGRRRELFRGRMPPEARQYLPAEALAQIEGASRP